MKNAAAKVLIRDSGGRYLFLYRSATHPLYAGHLDLPGGEVEPGETWSEAAEREVTEEIFITIPKEAITQLFKREHETIIHYLGAATLSEETPEISLSWEHHGYRWFTLEEILNEPIPENVDNYYADVISYLHSIK